ncbi:MAG: FAD-binding protein [Beijerinckiaceae bacterium]|nr:FAD-binding protein [Beijerinckiaceae bacterium]
MPLQVADAYAVDWDDEADIVIVGFGGAGVVTALQALEDGASVIAIDRFTGGGATEKSGGVVYAGGTRFQKDAGFDDSADEMYKYLRYEGTPVRDETLRRFCETSNANIEWLSSHGVPFGSACYENRVAYPPDGFFLYYTGMEKFRATEAYAAPRGHRTVGKGPTGANYFAPLSKAAREKGAKLILHAPVRRLVQDASGRVIGVDLQEIPEDRKAEHTALYRRVDPYKFNNSGPAEDAIAEAAAFEAAVPQIRRMIRARRGVILSAGGYNYNLRLFSRYRPIVARVYRDIVRGGSMGCDGSGIELGTTVGGGLSHMDRLFCTKGISPPEAFVNGVLVNMSGKRFIPEDAYVGNVGCAVSEQCDEGAAWLIVDNATYWAGIRQLLWPIRNAFSWWGMPALLNILLGGSKKAASMARLAERLGMDATGLAETMESYNRDARRGIDTGFAKLPQHLKVQDSGPWRAINMSMRNKWGFSGTMPYGGLTVSERSGHVTRPDGSIVAGLFAAGRTAVGVCSESNFSGLSIADTIFSGRRAARGALKSDDIAL